MRSWTAGADEGQIVPMRYGRERSGKLTLWLRSGLTGDWNGQGVDVQSAKDEGGKNGFGEHDVGVCRGEERVTMAPGLRFEGREELG